MLLAGDLGLVGPVPAGVAGGRRLVTAPTCPAHAPRLQFDHLLALGPLTASDVDLRQFPIGVHGLVTATVHPV